MTARSRKSKKEIAMDVSGRLLGHERFPRCSFVYPNGRRRTGEVHLHQLYGRNSDGLTILTELDVTKENLEKAGLWCSKKSDHFSGMEFSPDELRAKGIYDQLIAAHGL